jgi:vacuolar iron transporter family protein
MNDPRPSDLQQLRSDHSPASVRRRLAGARQHSYLGDAVLGGIDGCVTTFAVVSGSVGGNLPAMVIIVLGVANLVADGFSMGISNYFSSVSERQQVEKARRIEERHIQMFPEGEREEIRQIFAGKGFSGETLERIVTVITQDRRLWVDTMLIEELGFQLQGRSAVRAGFATFSAFVLVGSVPLLPFLFPGLFPVSPWAASATFTALTFAGIGLMKAVVVQQARWRSVLETLLIGGGAAVLAYGIGALLRRIFGAS